MDLLYLCDEMLTSELLGCEKAANNGLDQPEQAMISQIHVGG
jgi:hypothetical protein